MKKTIFGVRLDAILEAIIFLVVLYLVDINFGKGDRFIGVTPNPLWIILLLVLFQYSIIEAFVTIVFMCIFLYAWNLPPQLASQNIFEYYFSLSLRPALWIGMTILLGGLRLRDSSRLLELEKKVKDSMRNDKVISDSFAKLKEVNRALELRLSDELGSAMKIYRAAVTLEDLDPDNQIDGVNKIVAATLNPEKFSIYLKSEEGMVLSSSYAWETSDVFLKKFDKNSDIYMAIAGEKRILAAFDDASDGLLDREGIIAGPLVDSVTGEVFGMLKIEKMTFQSFNFRTVQLFTLLCEWIGLMLRKTRSVREMSGETINSQRHRSYSYAFLKAQTEFLEALAKRADFHLAKLNIRMVNPGDLSVEQRRQATASISAAIKNSLRKTDLLFDARERGEEYALLLCCTGEEHIDLVINKIKEQAGKAAGSDNPAKYAFSYQVLFHSDRKISQ